VVLLDDAAVGGAGRRLEFRHGIDGGNGSFRLAKFFQKFIESGSAQWKSFFRRQALRLFYVQHPARRQAH